MITVPYTIGSASPSQIAIAAQRRGHRTVFVVDPGDRDIVGHLNLLASFGTVVRATTPAAAIDGLAGEVPSAVVTFADKTLPMTSVLASHFGLPGLPRDVVPRVIDKGIQRRRLNDCCVGAVATVDVHGGQSLDQLHDIPLPGVLKPSKGAGSRDTVLVETAAQVADELARHMASSWFVVESWIEGTPSPVAPGLADYVSIESVAVGETVHHIGCTGRLPLAKPARERGLIFPVEPPKPVLDRLYETASAAISALGIGHGLVHTELKISPDGPQIIEVNARLGGGLSSIIPAAGGIDPVALAIDLALGQPCPPLRAATQTALHLYAQPPKEAVSMHTQPDISAIRGVPGVYGVDRHARAGDPIDWRNGSASRVLDVWIKADNLNDLIDRANRVESTVATTTGWNYE